MGEKNEVRAYPTMKLFVDGTVFEYDVQGRQSEAESSNDFADFGFFLDISSQSQVAAYREMGQQTLGKRPCPQVRGGFAIVAFYFNWWQSTEGLRSHNITQIISHRMQRRTCMTMILRLLAFFLKAARKLMKYFVINSGCCDHVQGKKLKGKL